VALGMGEKEDDLQAFNSEYFSNALMQFWRLNEKNI
jgi:signal recognition particle GTPase